MPRMNVANLIRASGRRTPWRRTRRHSGGWNARSRSASDSPRPLPSADIIARNSRCGVILPYGCRLSSLPSAKLWCIVHRATSPWTTYFSHIRARTGLESVSFGVLLSANGFSVFWDQAIPTNSDWDTWIRQNLRESKCAIILWSEHSITSDNVRHEAAIARQQNKLIPVLLDEIPADRFPMGHYTLQAQICRRGMAIPMTTNGAN